MKSNEAGLQLAWSDTLATGIAVIDAQHQRLFEIYNKAALAQKSLSVDAARDLLNELLDYSRYHFREEASLMRQWPIDASRREAHLKAHERFIVFLRKTQVMAKDHPADAIVDLLAFLAQWLLHHIAGVDARMAREIRALQAGLTSPTPDPLQAQGSPQEQLVDVVSELTDTLGEKTFDLLDQRLKILDLQGIYSALMRSSEMLIHGRDEQQILASLCAKLAQDTPFHFTWIGRPGPSGVFEVLAFGRKGVSVALDVPPLLTRQDTVPMVAKAWIHQDPVACNDTLGDATLELWHAAFRQQHWLSILAVPVMRAQRIWAVLTFVAARRDAFDERTTEVCMRIAGLLGFGLDELDLKAQIQLLQSREALLARTDALTQLPNRLALEEYLPQAIARAHRRGESLAIGMIDLDDFKPVNDRFGHATGDALLQKLGQTLRSRLRQTDFLARLGGDEFVIVFEELDTEHLVLQLNSMLDRLHTAVEEPFDLGEARRATVGMTMGLAIYPRDAQDADTLLREADAAMYASKSNKNKRPRWWQMRQDNISVEVGLSVETDLDAFDDEAKELLVQLNTQMMDAVAGKFVTSFYDELGSEPASAAVLRCLTAQELSTLNRSQDKHLRFLLDPSTSREMLETSAHAIGQTHALVGVSGQQMVHAFALYEDLLRSHLEATLLAARQRYRVVRLATARLRLHLQAQLDASEHTVDEYSALLESPIESSSHWSDALQSLLSAVTGLPGIAHAIVYRPDEHGVLRIEAGAGQDFATHFASNQTNWRLPVLRANADAQRGPLSMAWFSQQVQVVDAYLLDSRLEAWHDLARKLGWRSAAAIPISRGDITDCVLMIFGRYPHQFSSNWARRWLDALHSRINATIATTAQSYRPLSQDKIRFFRELLYDQHLQMWVQPIVDLRTGQLCKVEALARLQSEDAKIYMPGQFLQAFGEQELHALFCQGLRQALQWLHDWLSAGLSLDISVNLPLETLIHPDCVTWIELALRETEVAPHNLTLEILEDGRMDHARCAEAIDAISKLGVRLALDDLGAGYSSLSRLASLPIDTVKVDQSLIQQLPQNPLKTVRLLATIMRIGHDFANRTVVEGLENDDFIEVAQLLGAHLGQGFGLAKPMPSSDFLAWAANLGSSHQHEHIELRSWSGAMTYHWLCARNEDHPYHHGELAACPLSRFLSANHIDDPDVLNWHNETHYSAYLDSRQKSSAQLLEWLSRQTISRLH